MSVSVSLRDVTKQYDGKAVVDRLDLAAAAGEATVILGPSGCGKTTTLRIIAGLCTPDEGSVHLGERCVNDPRPLVAPRRRGVGMVFQSLALWPHMTVEGNLRFVATGDGVEDRVRDVLDLVGLGDRRLAHPSELSGGEQQRVALARALVGRPEVLLLDEPLASLDEDLRKRMLESMRELKDRLGVTTLFVTHSQKEALAFADTVVVMRNGRSLQTGTPETLYRKPATEFVARFLGENNVFDAEAGPDGRVHTVLGWVEGHRSPSPGPVTVVLRPEDVLLGPASKGAAGTVVSSAFAGSHHMVRVSVQGVEMLAHHGERVAPGGEVGVTWRNEPVVIPKESDGGDRP